MKIKTLQCLSALLLTILQFTNCSFSTNLNNFNLGKLFQVGNERFLGRIQFIYQGVIDQRPEYVLNVLDYKIIQITNTEMTVYAPKTDAQFTLENASLDTSNYLLTIKLQDIDLPCNDYLSICTLGEFKREYMEKFPDVNFIANKNVISKLGESKANSNCLILTQGPVNDIKQFPYLCFESLENMIYIQSMLTERIFKLNSEKYSGALQLIKSSGNDFYFGILELQRDYFQYSISIGRKMKIKYESIVGYASTAYKNHNINWTGNPKDKPVRSRCFQLTVRKGIKDEKLYFCSYYARSDFAMSRPLTPSNSIFIIELWVARVNMMLHMYNLKKAQSRLPTLDKVSCEDNVMEPIKYEIRLRYLIARHKVKQLIVLKKIEMNKALEVIDESKAKIIDTTCLSYQPCITAAELCIAQGLLPLKLKGYQIATSLKNPFISLVPKHILAHNKNPNDLITRTLLGKTKAMLNQNTNEPNVVFMSDTLTEVPSQDDIKKAFNTFAHVFKNRGKHVTRIEESQRFCRWLSRGSIHELKRKIHLLTFSSMNEPFFEYMGHINEKLIKNTI